MSPPKSEQEQNRLLLVLSYTKFILFQVLQEVETEEKDVLLFAQSVF